MNRPAPRMVRLSGPAAARMVYLAAELATSSPASRTIRGRIVNYGTRASASTGPVVIHAGSLRVPDDLSRVKLLVDHDHRQPVGYMTEHADHDTHADGAFHVPEGEAGDRALHEAANRLRDGLSVGVWPDDDGYHIDDDGYFHVTAGELREVTLCAIPAIDDARVEDVAASSSNNGRNTMLCTLCGKPHAPGVACHTPAPAPAPASAPEPVAASGAPAAEPPAPDPAPAPAPEPAPAPAPVVRQAAPAAPPAPRGRVVTLRQAAQLVSSLVRNGAGAAEVRAALNDVTPASIRSADMPASAEDPFLRDSYVGQLWTASKTERPFIDLLGTPKDVTGLKVVGWKWEVKPAVGPYSGNKAEIPTNTPKLKPTDAPTERTAGGWDVDRIYVDLGDPALIEALWEAAVEDYRAKTEAKVAAALHAAASTADPATTFAAALVNLGTAASTLGANISGVGIASDVWGAFAALTRDEVPWWLGGGDSLSIGTTQGVVGGVKFFVSPALPAGGYMGIDSRAATYYEKNPPIRVNAIDLAHGGVDLGLFGYHGLIVNDSRAIIKGTVTPPAAEPVTEPTP